MITSLLDHLERSMGDRFGSLLYFAGPFSAWGSVFNAIVSGLLVVFAIVITITEGNPVGLFFVGIVAVMHTLFVLIAVRVHTGRTLYDRHLLADLEEEEREKAD